MYELLLDYKKQTNKIWDKALMDAAVSFAFLHYQVSGSNQIYSKFFLLCFPTINFWENSTEIMSK